jgi:hypothetical protein
MIERVGAARAAPFLCYKARRPAAETTSRLLTQPPYREAVVPAFKDITGQKFGRLTVVGSLGGSRWRCRCDCGTEKDVTGANLGRSTTSCGCFHREKTARLNYRHGHNFRAKTTSIYSRWAALVQRCTNPRDRAWPWYGARGITVCERWLIFENFLADVGEPPTGLTLDRIDNDRGYEPGNCRWVTMKEQAANRRPRT